MRKSGTRELLRVFSKKVLLTSARTPGLIFGAQGVGGERLPLVSASDLAAPSIPKYSVGSRPPDEANSTGPPLGMVMPPRLVVRRVWLRCGAVRRLMFL